jgi:hypothetical protein
VLLMVQGHAFRVILSDATRAERWFHWHDFVHGFTAPAFLFGAGLAYGVATFPRFEAHTRLGPASYRRFGRYALLVVLGCALHLPDMSVTRALAEPSRALAALQLGPLQLIGAVLAAVEAAALLTRSRRAVAGLCAAGAAAVLLAAPVVWRLGDAGALPEAARALLTGGTGSTFPVFPWGGLALVGVGAAHLALDETGALRPRAPRWFALVGLALLATTYALYRLRLDPYGPHDFWRTNPLYTGFLLGGVALALGLASAAAGALPRVAAPVVDAIARQSLVVYVAHLLVLYGSPLTPGLRKHLGPTLGLAAGAAVTAALVAAMVALALGWTHLGKRRAEALRTVRVSMAGVFVYVLLLR